jgi:hypothetical protein
MDEQTEELSSSLEIRQLLSDCLNEIAFEWPFL